MIKKLINQPYVSKWEQAPKLEQSEKKKSSSSTMAMGSTQPLTEMSTRNLPGGKGQRARKADNFTAIYETTV
jgi:hypothetical protein